MITLAIVGMLCAGLIGFVVGVVWQSENGPDHDEFQ